MNVRRAHSEPHRLHRSGWLRAAVMGANDGIVSTASLIIGVAAAGSSLSAILLAGVAGLVAGAMSMAAGEYVSVSSQADIEAADLRMEKHALQHDTEAEHRELADIYVERGVAPDLAHAVAGQLMAHDALDAHARDEIGIVDRTRARPITAALSSGATFSIGAALPLLATLLLPSAWLIPGVAGASLLSLALLGLAAAHTGGAPRLRGMLRVLFWGALAMGLTHLVGGWFGVRAA